MKILIVSPTFPPDNTPDLHRVRMMLPFLLESGHDVIVLSVDPRFTEAPKDQYLARALPQGLKIIRVKALDYRMTRALGLGNLAIRSFPFLLRQGSRIIRSFKPDIVFFSTTMFLSMPLGRIWKRRFKVPFILDFQDPWRNDYYKSLPKDKRPHKYWFIHSLNKFFERWTVPYADGIVAVNQTYIDLLSERYGKRQKARTIVLPMGAPSSDFDYVRNNPPSLPVKLDKATINAVYTGVVPDNMLFSIEAILRAIKQYNLHAEKKIKLYFIGTNYGPKHLHRERVLALARKLAVEKYVHERAERVSYFEAIRLVQMADFLLLPGTTDHRYTPSKFFVYALSSKPILAVFHDNSPLKNTIKETTDLPFITFTGETDMNSLVDSIEHVVNIFVSGFKPQIDKDKFTKYTDRYMTQRFLSFAVAVIKQNSARSV